MTQLSHIASMDEFRQSVLGLIPNPDSQYENLERVRDLGLKDEEEGLGMRFSPGLEEFVQYALANGRAEQLEKIWTGIRYRRSIWDGESKTLINESNGTTYLFVLRPDSYLNRKRACQELNDFSPHRANDAQVLDLGMLPYGCSPFPSAQANNPWQVIADNNRPAEKHPIYQAGTTRMVGFLNVPLETYIELMNGLHQGKARVLDLSGP